MEKDELVIKGKHYNVNTINKLPKSLKPAKISSQTNNTTYGYFGMLNPLSNFYPAPFSHNEVEYHRSEQFIQHEKAKLFNDQTAIKRILNAKSGAACKEAGRKITNFKQEKWNKKAKSLCLEGIKQKYLANEEPRRLLLSTKNKVIVECTKDTTWGCGMTLSNESCLNKTLWTGQGKGQGIMGEMLEIIRNSLRQLPGNITPNSSDDDDGSLSDSSDSSSSMTDTEPAASTTPIVNTNSNQSTSFDPMGDTVQN